MQSKVAASKKPMIKATEARRIALDSIYMNNSIRKHIREAAEKGLTQVNYVIPASTFKTSVTPILHELVNDGYTIIAETKNHLQNITDDKGISKLCNEDDSDETYKEDISIDIAW